MASVKSTKQVFLKDITANASMEVKTGISSTGDGFAFQGQMRPTDTVTDLAGSGGTVPATDVDLLASNSGLIVLVPALSGGAHTLELPPCADAVGCTWTFVVTGSTATQDFNITTNGSEKILAAVPDGAGNNTAASQAYDSIGFDENAPIGSRISITCISSTAGTAFIAHDILDGLANNTAGINVA